PNKLKNSKAYTLKGDNVMAKKVVVAGAFDTKAEEYKFIIDLLKEKEYQVISINTGILGSTDLFPIDIPAGSVAEAADTDLESLRKANDRGKAVALMSEGLGKLIESLYAKEIFDGMIGMGGTAGTNLV